MKRSLRRVIARRRVFISNATIDGQFALRACFVNHRGDAEDVRGDRDRGGAALAGELNQ